MQKLPKIIIGIDPGTLLMGYGIIEISSNVICMKEMSVLKLSGKKDNYIRLQLIHQKILVLTIFVDSLSVTVGYFKDRVDHIEFICTQISVIDLDQ